MLTMTKRCDRCGTTINALNSACPACGHPVGIGWRIVGGCATGLFIIGYLLGR